MEQQQKNKGRDQWQLDIIILLMLAGFAFWVNRGIEMKGLYMDDLYMWSCYGEQSFMEYVFPIGSTRFRFIYYLVAYVILWGIGPHVTWLVPINILLNTAIAATVYVMAKKMSRCRVIGGTCGALYLLSRMAYYQIGQLYGLMESFALWAAIGILFCFYMYLNEKKHNRRYLLWANVLYFAVCFIHERYMVLLPVFFLVLLFVKNKDWRDWLVTVGNFAVIQVIRLLTIGTVAPAGTGGTDVADTFSVGDTILHALSQVAYTFGINAGPEHLNGCTFQDSPKWIKLLILASDVMLLALVILFLVEIIRRKERRVSYIQNAVLFIVMIGGCIASASVTIRVELRWVYVSYTMAILLLAYIYGCLTREESMQVYPWKKLLPYGLLFGAYALLMIPTQLFYRGKFSNIYLWPNQLRYNSLAEQTYERYGDALFGKTIYIMGNSYEMSDFTAETFFKVYDQKRKAEGTTVVFIDDLRDIGQVTDQMLVLREDPAHNGYQDITDYVRSLKCEILYGYYRDGWMDEDAAIRVMAGADGKISLEFMYPGNLVGNEEVTMILNRDMEQEIAMTENIIRRSVQVRPYETVELEFHNNFYLPDAQEQRGEKKLSVIMNIKTE